MTDLNRRRFITLFASTASIALVSPKVFAAPDKLHRWQGTALGAEAAIYLDGLSQDQADEMISAALSEIERLENMFSLYRPEATISRLNRDGFVENPEQEFVELMSRAAMISRHTDGAFDPTIQTVWARLTELSQQIAITDEGAVHAEIGRLKSLIGYEAIRIEPNRVSFAQQGMQVTLNGMAQGYITDRVAGVFRRNGMKNVLVDLGEKYAIGPRIDGTGWPVRFGGNDAQSSSGVRMYYGALATSSGSGFRFSLNGNYTHLIDPRSGTSPALWERVSVFADTATDADAFSTAFSMMRETEIRHAARHLPVRKILLVPLGKATEIQIVL
jgi:thiamine biosynthesis lipoprotein